MQFPSAKHLLCYIGAAAQADCTACRLLAVEQAGINGDPAAFVVVADAEIDLQGDIAQLHIVVAADQISLHVDVVSIQRKPLAAYFGGCSTYRAVCNAVQVACRALRAEFYRLRILIPLHAKTHQGRNVTEFEIVVVRDVVAGGGDTGVVDVNGLPHFPSRNSSNCICRARERHAASQKCRCAKQRYKVGFHGRSPALSIIVSLLYCEGYGLSTNYFKPKCCDFKGRPQVGTRPPFNKRKRTL